MYHQLRVPPIYVIDKGIIVFEGRVKELSEDKEIMKEYLGV